MANVIKIKRKPQANGAGVPNGLSAGELAFSEADAKLFYGLDTAGTVSPIEIAGSGYVLSKIASSAGSGLLSNGTGNNTSLHVGPGDGISVSDNAIAVNNTVVRTTGNNQFILGGVTFYDSSETNVILSTSDNIVRVKAPNTNDPSQYFVVLDGGGSPPSSTSADRSLVSRSTSQVKTDLSLNNVENTALSTWVGSTNIATLGTVVSGTWNASAIAVNRGGTGQTSYSNGQLLIGSGTSLAANTLTAGTGISITNGSGTITINNSRTGSTSIVVSGLEYQRAALTGDVTASQNNNATTIANDAVTNAKAANMAVNTIKGRITTGTGDPEDLTAANVRTIINVADGANNYTHPTDGANTTITAANLKVLSAITVNTLGHVTSVSSKDLTANDIPTLNQNTTGNAGSVTNGVYTTGDQTINGAKTFGNAAVFNSGLSANSQKITNLGTPTADSDAATKAYVDAARSGLDVKQSVRVATTQAFNSGLTVTYSGGNSISGTNVGLIPNIDGTTLANGDRILVKDESNSPYNGIYTVTSIGGAGSSWSLSRSTDADSNDKVTAGMFTFVTAGTLNADTGWVLTTNDAISLGVSGLSFAQFSGAGQISAVSGLAKNGNSLGLASAYGDSVNPYGSKTANTVLAAPNGSAGTPSFRALVSSDIPSLGSITNAGAIGSAANIPIITTTNGVLSAGSFGTAANTFCQGDDSRLSNTRNTTQSLTVNNGGAGTASSFTFNGGTAQTISYNSIGAPSISGANATGTWNISVTGNAATVTNGVYTNGSYSDPSWLTLSKSKVGLGNVENTALSSWAGSTNLTTLGTISTGTWGATTIAVDKGGTGQTIYSNGQLLIGSGTGLARNTLTQGTGIVITNGSGTITINHNDTSTLNGIQGGNGISSITVDELGHVTAVGLPASAYLTSGTVCAAIVDCTIDGGTFS